MIFNTNFTYTLFYTVGKADSYIKPYKISDDFMIKSGVKLIPLKENIFCGKLMLNTGEINIFTQSLKIDEKSKYYRIPSSKISLYQGNINCKTEDK
ncbi:hypothetical protein BKG92_04280 [Rodentibacter ratti]|uniref:Uncharacterized protein n=1 Tax=Rodentibacter ratti TaxID=1906745 RepID=A0A1V3KZM2_9PAST|nr:hypothetical protein BKG92_04280 [Rodentibacter ratti]